MRITTSHRSGLAAAPLALAVAMTCLVTACGQAGTSAGTGSRAGTTAATGTTSPTSSAPSTSPSSPPSSPPSSRTVGAVSFTWPQHRTCSTKGLQASAHVVRTEAGVRTAELEVFQCGSASYPMADKPSLTVLDSTGSALPVRVVAAASTADGSVQLRPYAPFCLVLSWSTRGTTAASTGNRVTVAASGQRPALSVALPVDLGTDRTLTTTAWSASSGECAGSN